MHSPSLSESEARAALDAAPLRWEWWWSPGLLAVLVLLPTVVAGVVLGSTGLGILVAMATFVALGAPVLLLARATRARLRAENVVHELVAGRVREHTGPRGRARRLLVDLADGRTLRASGLTTFAESLLGAGAEVWVANPASGWRSRVVFRGEGGTATVAYLVSLWEWGHRRAVFAGQDERLDRETTACRN